MFEKKDDCGTVCEWVKKIIFFHTFAKLCMLFVVIFVNHKSLIHIHTAKKIKVGD